MIRFDLNGKTVTAGTEPGERLIDLLRERFGLTGTKEGCGQGECGACTVIVDGDAVHACLMSALQADGRSVVTIEGVAGPEGEPSVYERAFVEKGAVQCGFCTPGMIMSAKALLDRDPDPDEETIRRALSGNLCRCTGYVKIIEAVRYAAELLKKDGGCVS